MSLIHRSNPSILLLSLLLYVAAPASFAAPGSDSAGANVFSVPQEGDEGAAAKFTEPDGRPRAGRGERIPGWQEIRMIPSLSGENKKLVQQLFNKSKTDALPLQEEMKTIRTQILEQGKQAAAANGPDSASKGGANTVASTQKVNGGIRSDGPRRIAGKATPEQKARMDALKAQMHDLRVKTWEQVKPLLTAQNLQDLELMKQGKLLPDNLQRHNAQANADVGSSTRPHHRRAMADGAGGAASGTATGAATGAGNANAGGGTPVDGGTSDDKMMREQK